MGKKLERRIDRESKTKLLYRVAYLFFAKGMKVAEIATTINCEFKTAYTREAIYPMLSQIRDRNFVRFVPPLENRLSEELQEQFKHSANAMRIVGLDGDSGGEIVTEAAAEMVLEMIRELWDQLGRPVGLGLGPGRARWPSAVT